MTIRNLIPLLSIAAAVALLAVPFGATVRAQEGRGIGVSLDARAQVGVNQNADDDDSATSTDEEDDDDASGNGRGDEMRASARADAQASTTDEKENRGRGEEHRSAVATFVHSLLAIADRDGGIGAEVREVARSQNDSASTTAEAMAKVEKRSALATLLIGTDWKSIGLLKKSIRQAESDIERLQALLDETTDAAVRAELEAQIDALVDAQAEVEAFVEEHEGSFSLFGWFTKIFASASTDDSADEETENDTATTTE